MKTNGKNNSLNSPTITKGSESQGTAVADNEKPEEQDPLVDALDQLHSALDLHRLTFLYFANATRRNPENGNKGPLSSIAFGWENIPSILSNLTEEELKFEGDEFILNLRDKLNLHAQKALRTFGSGKGLRPKHPATKGWVEVEGSTYPFWVITDDATKYLEDTSDRILHALRKLSAADTKHDFSSLIDEVQRVVHDENQPRWCSAKPIRWEYLEELDSAISSVKKLIVNACKGCEDKPQRKKGAKRKKNKQEPRFLAWTNYGDACFIVNGKRIIFHHEYEVRDLRLKNGSQAHSIFLWLNDGKGISSEDILSLCKKNRKSKNYPLEEPEIDDLLSNKKTKKSKPYHVVRNVNKLLNNKLRAFGFVGIPKYDVMFIRYDRVSNSYVCCIPVKSQEKFDREHIQEIVH